MCKDGEKGHGIGKAGDVNGKLERDARTGARQCSFNDGQGAPDSGMESAYATCTRDEEERAEWEEVGHKHGNE